LFGPGCGSADGIQHARIARAARGDVAVSRSAAGRAGTGRGTRYSGSAQFPDPRPAGVPGRVHSAHSAQGRAPDPLFRLVLERGPRHALEGGGRRRVPSPSGRGPG
jgi:hypothetical protein